MTRYRTPDLLDSLCRGSRALQEIVRTTLPIFFLSWM